MSNSNQEDITIINAKEGEKDEKGLELYLKEERLKEEAKDARELFSTIQDELDHREEDIKDGLSFLDMKNDTLLSYMIDVCNIVLRKVRRETIEGHRSVERCVEYRVILEKIKAIDQKLAYQLNKLITLPDDAPEEQGIDIQNLDIDIESDAEEAGHEKSNIESDEDESGGDESFQEDDEEDESGQGSDVDEGSDDDGFVAEPPANKPSRPVKTGATGGGVYKPPKLRSVAYTDDTELKRGNKGRRKNYDEFYQDEEQGDINPARQRRNSDDERTKFEEENYTRLPDENPKKAKRKLKTKEYRKKGRNNKAKRRRR